MTKQIPPRGGIGERLTLGFDFSLFRSISGTARLFYEQPKSPGFTIPLEVILILSPSNCKQKFVE